MSKVFKKEKMLQRLVAENKMNMVDDQCREIMEKIDGLEVHKNDFKALVHDKLEFYVRHPELGNITVNINDCVEE